MSIFFVVIIPHDVRDFRFRNNLPPMLLKEFVHAQYAEELSDAAWLTNALQPHWIDLG